MTGGEDNRCAGEPCYKVYPTREAAESDLTRAAWAYCEAAATEE